MASRIGGVIACAVVAVYTWWLGLLLLVTWIAVRRYVLVGVVRQATELRAQTNVMRRAWYFISVGSRARDAKEVRVFGLGDFMAERFRDEYDDAIRNGSRSLRSLHTRAALSWVIVLGGLATAAAANASLFDRESQFDWIERADVALSTLAVAAFVVFGVLFHRRGLASFTPALNLGYLLEASRFAPCRPELVTSPAAQRPGTLVRPSRSTVTPPTM